MTRYRKGGLRRERNEDNRRGEQKGEAITRTGEVERSTRKEKEEHR